MLKTIKTIAATTMLLTASAASYAALPFSIDTTGDTTKPFALSLDQFETQGMSGDYSEAIRVNPDGSFAATILLNINSFDGITAGASGLDINYGLYSVINITGQVLANNIGTGGSVITGNWGGDFNIVWDKDLDSNAVGATVTDLNTINFGAGVFGDDVELLTGTIKSGGSSGTANNGGYNLLSDDVELTAVGETFFTAPNPFYTMLISTGDLENFFSLVDFTNFTDAQFFEGEASIAFVPEPSALSIVGLGLLGAAFAARRRKAK